MTLPLKGSTTAPAFDGSHGGSSAQRSVAQGTVRPWGAARVDDPGGQRGSGAADYAAGAGSCAGEAAGLVPRGQVRALHPLGPLCDSCRGVEREALARSRRMDHEPLADTGEGVRAARHEVQSCQVRPGCLGPARAGRGDEVHRHHLQASRWVRDVRLEGQRVQHRRRDAVQARRAQGARRRVRETEHASGLLLLAGAGLARAGRRGQYLGLRSRPGAGRQGAQGIRRVPP